MPSLLPGRLYSLFIDPLLRRVRKDVADRIDPGASVLEIASGSGAQARILAEMGCRVLGIDLDSRMVAYASSRITGDVRDRLEFRAADGRQLDEASDSRDVAAVTLALHAMPADVRLPVLCEMRRIAPTLVIADYTSPLPRTFSGRFARSLEHLAGGEHLAGFRSYQAAGGLTALLDTAGMRIRDRQLSLGGVVEIISAE